MVIFYKGFLERCKVFFLVVVGCGLMGVNGCFLVGV